MNELEIVDAYLTTCVNLQLSALQGLSINERKMNVSDLYKNLKKYNTIFDLNEFNYSNFLNFLNQHKDKFSSCEGEIGVDVNLIGLKT